MKYTNRNKDVWYIYAAVRCNCAQFRCPRFVHIDLLIVGLCNWMLRYSATIFFNPSNNINAVQISVTVMPATGTIKLYTPVKSQWDRNVTVQCRNPLNPGKIILDSNEFLVSKSGVTTYVPFIYWTLDNQRNSTPKRTSVITVRFTLHVTCYT